MGILFNSNKMKATWGEIPLAGYFNGVKVFGSTGDEPGPDPEPDERDDEFVLTCVKDGLVIFQKAFNVPLIINDEVYDEKNIKINAKVGDEFHVRIEDPWKYRETECGMLIYTASAHLSLDKTPDAQYFSDDEGNVKVGSICSLFASALNATVGGISRYSDNIYAGWELVENQGYHRDIIQDNYIPRNLTATVNSDCFGGCFVDPDSSDFINITFDGVIEELEYKELQPDGTRVTKHIENQTGMNTLYTADPVTDEEYYGTPVEERYAKFGR